MILAYFDIYKSSHEYIELVGADELPTVGGTITFTEGENEGSWHICGVKMNVENEIYDAAVFLDVREGAIYP